MSGWGRKAGASRLLCAAALAAYAVPARAAQELALPPAEVPDSADLDPDAPLEPLPDLGVEWPDLNAVDAIEEPTSVEPGVAAPGQPQAPDLTDDGSGERRYAWSIIGIDGLGDSEAMLATFRK